MPTPPSQMERAERVHPIVSLDQDAPWVLKGIAAGLTGAVVIALLFLVRDAFLGRPLWTPNALGSALFLGRAPEAGAAASLALVAGYSAVHGAVFLALGLGAAFALFDLEMQQVPRGALAVMITGTLFTAVTIAFLLFAALFGSVVGAELGAARVASANLIAAATMATLLVRRM